MDKPASLRVVVQRVFLPTKVIYRSFNPSLQKGQECPATLIQRRLYTLT